jgi:hypothetical protein
MEKKGMRKEEVKGKDGREEREEGEVRIGEGREKMREGRVE